MFPEGGVASETPGHSWCCFRGFCNWITAQKHTGLFSVPSGGTSALCRFMFHEMQIYTSCLVLFVYCQLIYCSHLKCYIYISTI